MIDQINPQILIVDDHPSVRSGVRRAIEGAGLRCCGEAASRDEAVAQIALHDPDGVVLDLNLPDGSGLDVISWIREHSQTMAIVILTMSDEDSYLLAAMKSGASAYVKKSAPLSQLIASLKAALAQPNNFSAPGMASIISITKISLDLTPRELSVLKALSLEGANKDLARSLFISEATFKTHLASIYTKMGVSSRFSAINKARNLNLL
ncbi:MAG: response regulator transcription factor [Candidatus Planktophila sp.]|nr:response regulator transcription factor [Candidatus Planktophila sp.]